MFKWSECRHPRHNISIDWNFIYRDYDYVGIGTNIDSGPEPNVDNDNDNAPDSEPGDDMEDNPGDADKHGDTAAYVEKPFVTEFDQLFIEMGIMYVQAFVFPSFINRILTYFIFLAHL